MWEGVGPIVPFVVSWISDRSTVRWLKSGLRRVQKPSVRMRMELLLPPIILCALFGVRSLTMSRPGLSVRLSTCRVCVPRSRMWLCGTDSLWTPISVRSTGISSICCLLLSVGMMWPVICCTSSEMPIPVVPES